MFRLLCCSVVVVAFAACGPAVPRCDADDQCEPTEYCVQSICVVRSVLPRDAGVDAGIDAGVIDEVPDAGSQPVDAGTPDAGVESACDTGETRECCGGRGEQTCQAIDGGFGWTTCDATTSNETCNGVDDDCNGTIDDGVFLESDGGANADAGCFVGVGACGRSGTFTCSMNMPVCDAAPGQPSAELCNTVDDDCDGATDENVTCPIAGQTCLAGACVCGANQEVCGGTCQTVGAACSTGIGACGRSGVFACTSGAVSCNAIAGQPTVVSCNNIDDDCDGETDEGSSICSVSGQSCVAGSCVCPAGQVACGGSCQTVGATCATGVGACSRNGVMACSAAGTVTCNAVAGTPATEVCDGVDNDCDGETDELLRIGCVADSDNDRYANAAGQAVSMLCRDNTRASAGYCPSGFVAPGTSQGFDCAPQNAALFQQLYISPDADNDARCTTTGTLTCIGATPPAGYRLSTTCVSPIDCAPNDATKYRNENLRDDFDQDHYCAGPTVLTCIGDAAPAGKRLASTCNAVDDCRDTNIRASTSCSAVVRTGNFAKRCGGGLAPSEQFEVSWTCPDGFAGKSGSPVYLGHIAPTQANAPKGTSVTGGFFGSIDSKTLVTATCTTAFTDDLWRVDVTCEAL